jgi:glutathione S-transferase
MSVAQLTISSRNYSSWSLRAWIFCRLAGLRVEVVSVPVDDPGARAELLLLSPTVLTPRLDHNGASVWDTLAIAEYLHEIRPKAGMLPADRISRAHCRSVCGEMHSGFVNLRSALPMNLRARYQDFRIFTGALADIRRIEEIWSDCLSRYGGPWMFGEAPTMADGMYAPVATRFQTYGVRLNAPLQDYADRILAWTPMREWAEAAKLEPQEIEELDMEF